MRTNPEPSNPTALPNGNTALKPNPSAISPEVGGPIICPAANAAPCNPARVPIPCVRPSSVRNARIDARDRAERAPIINMMAVISHT